MRRPRNHKSVKMRCPPFCQALLTNFLGSRSVWPGDNEALECFQDVLLGDSARGPPKSISRPGDGPMKPSNEVIANPLRAVVAIFSRFLVVVDAEGLRAKIGHDTHADSVAARGESTAK